MAQFPLDPSISRMLIQASEENCLNEVLTIAAMLSADNIWYSRRTRRGERDEEAEAAHASLRHPKVKNTRKLLVAAHTYIAYRVVGCLQGDHFTFLHLYEQWIEHGCSDEWCTANFVRRRALMLAKRVRAQLADEAEKLGLRFNEKKASDRRISKAICAGFFYNAARRCVNESVFRSLPMGSEDVKLMHLHPQSALAFVRPPEYVVYQVSWRLSFAWLRLQPAHRPIRRAGVGVHRQAADAQCGGGGCELAADVPEPGARCQSLPVRN